jgi:hypothetical protein
MDILFSVDSFEEAKVPLWVHYLGKVSTQSRALVATIVFISLSATQTMLPSGQTTVQVTHA